MADTTVEDCKVTDVDECQCQDHCSSPRAVPHLSFGPPHTAPSSPPASPSPRKAYPNFSASLNTYFPGAQRESLFWDCCVEALETHGFKDDNTIACIGVCRDEICGTLMDEVKKRFGDLFIFRGLAGFIFCGKTGLKAAHAHSPICNETGREKYLYVVAAHIGVSADGTLGRVDRRGRGGEASYACGALAYFHSMLVKGQVDTRLAMDDIEMSVMSQLLIHNIKWGTVPDMAELTKLASRVIVQSQLEEIIRETVDTRKADYAIIAGVQIHGPGFQQNYFYPMDDLCYGMVEGKRVTLDVGESRPRRSASFVKRQSSHIRPELENYIPSAGPCAAFTD